MNGIVRFFDVALSLQLARWIATQCQVHHAVGEQFVDPSARRRVTGLSSNPKLRNLGRVPEGGFRHNLEDASQAQEKAGEFRSIEGKAFQFAQIALARFLRDLRLDLRIDTSFWAVACLKMLVQCPDIVCSTPPVNRRRASRRNTFESRACLF